MTIRPRELTEPNTGITCKISTRLRYEAQYGGGLRCGDEIFLRSILKEFFFFHFLGEFRRFYM